MTDFPTEAKLFYQLRDDRTNCCVSSPAYQGVSCVVTLAESAMSTVSGRVLATVACNLLSRWCRNITIVTPKAAGFVDAALDVMRDADPFGTFTAGTVVPRDAQVQLHLGAGGSPCARHLVAADAGGWHAYLGTAKGPALATDERNVLGAIAAACLGVAQVFKLALGMPPNQHLRSGVFDLYRLAWADAPSDPEASLWSRRDLGRLLLVGAGSVGSSVAYCLQVAGLAADLFVVDKDVVGVENLNRSPLFGPRTFGLPKVAALATALADSDVRCTPFPGWWEELVSEPSRVRGAFDVWLPLANERGVRWSMQNNVPPLMIHTSTGINWGVNFGRHIPGRDDCLVDRFPTELRTEELACSTATVAAPGARIDAALPFLSVFAGLLVVADLVRLQLAGYPQVPNFGLFDFGGDLSVPILADRRPRAGCICHSQSELAASLHARTRYANFFGVTAGI